MNYENVKLGAQKPIDDPRTLKASAFKVDKYTYPESYDLTSEVLKFPMYNNDTVGCCTCAAMGHLDLARDDHVGISTPLSDDDILTAYQALTLEENGKAYTPDDPDTDTGALLIDSLKYWASKGEVGAYIQLDNPTVEMVKFAISTFGGVYCGVRLPKSAQNQNIWKVCKPAWWGKNKPGSWGGHALSLLNYDADYFRCVTWGEVKELTPEWLETYCLDCQYGEVWAVITPEHLTGHSGVVNGFDYDKLKEALNNL